MCTWIFQGIKRLGRHADHSPPPSTKVKNEWSHTSATPTRLHGMKGKNLYLCYAPRSQVGPIFALISPFSQCFQYYTAIRLRVALSNTSDKKNSGRVTFVPCTVKPWTTSSSNYSFQCTTLWYIYTHTHTHTHTHMYTGCPRKNVRDFGRVFLTLNYTDIAQNTYIKSWTVTEIMAREVWNFDSCYTLTDCQIHIETGRNMWFL